MRLYSYYSVLHFSNCYVLGPAQRGEAVLIDPGVFDEGLLRLLEEGGLYPRNVLLTHSDHGHVGGLRTLLKVYDITIWCFDPARLEFPAQAVRGGEPLRCGELAFQVLETPGHSADSLCYRLDNLLFTGDTLSAGSVGRTTSAYFHAMLVASIRKQILPLEGDLVILPGHGPPSTLVAEKAFNPYLAAGSPPLATIPETVSGEGP
jgi:hydroxyacylglutathione hydrolase